MIPAFARRWLSRGRTLGRRAGYQLAPGPRGGRRLHLGCGGDYWPGYVNVDASPASQADLCLDFTGLRAAFEDGSIAEVSMIHSLSYLRLWQARDLFRDLHALMEPGGRLILELPDLAKCASHALASSGRLDDYLEGVRGLYAFDLNEIAAKAMFTTYAFGWSSWHLKLELEEAGFRDVTVMDPQTHDRRTWRDTRIEATK